MFTALALLDLCLMEPTVGHFVSWAVASGLLLIVLTPPRVRAEQHEWEARGLFTCQRVRTDRLATVHMSEGVAQRLVLRDTQGERLVLDPRVLVANPLLWHALDNGARRSIVRGTLVCGSDVLDRLGQRIDNTVCQGILESSGLKRPPQHKSWWQRH
ncbi:hypothetical protein [Streptomyces sp. TRM68367]|uniref:hypothetical protein n=1 Tax=Streptomyces sp. TRM68367 TaxID=2758415 RepID=UPI00165BC33A|nr:hypothetical protein [Streptomyces sp. TRM68367]MBC9731181.1 hypothetical protein [Streptomyces sp. TRM68367]